MKVIDWPAHVGLVPTVTLTETAGVTVGVIFIVIELEVVVELPHDKVVVMLQLTTWLFVNELEEYVVLFVPTFPPFTIH